MENDKNKEIVRFYAALSFTEKIKIRDGVKELRFKWDIFKRFYRWIKSLLPTISLEEIGAKYISNSTYLRAIDGKLVSIELPEININEQVLCKEIAIAIEQVVVK